MNQFNIDIPRKDHTMEIKVEKVEGEKQPTFNLFYCDQFSGCMYCNEHSIWIYEPHGHEALLLSAEEIQHLGKQISQQAS